MKIVDLVKIDGMVERFRADGNAAFQPLADHYKRVCRNWYAHISKYMPTEREEFESDFQSLLFRSLLRFNRNRDAQSRGDVISKFDTYFIAAVRKRASGMKRAYMAMKRQIDRHVVSLSDGGIDFADEKVESNWRMIEVMDAIGTLRDDVDRKMLTMRVEGATRKEVCETLNMPLHTYRARIGRIQGAPSIVSLATSL